MKLSKCQYYLEKLAIALALVLGLTFFSKEGSASNANSFAAVAHLRIQIGPTDVFSIETMAEPTTAVIDPLICRRTLSALEHYKKVQREIEYLLTQMQRRPDKISISDLNELSALELKKQDSLDFMAVKAPTLLAVWDLSSLPENVFEKIYAENVSASIESFSVTWQNSNGLFLTEQAQVTIHRSHKTLALMIRSALSSFCLTERTIQLTIRDIKDSE